MAPFLILGGIVAIVVTSLLIGLYVERKRRERFAAWAGAHGLAYDGERRPDLDRVYRVPRFANGRARYGVNHCEGEWDGHRVHGFEYHYQTTSGSGKHRRTVHHWFTVAVVFGGLPMPGLAIRPEGALDRLAEFIGWDDIDFESAEFSRRYHVSAGDRKWAFAVLHPAAIEFLLANPPESLALVDDVAVAWFGGRWEPAKLGEGFAIAAGLLDRLPRYLVKQLEGDA